MKNIIPLKDGRSLFGIDVDAYQEGRPDYPPRVYELLIEYCHSKSYRFVLEVGPGAGLATQHLLEMGYQIKAIEPDKNLAGKLEKRFEHQSITVINSAFEDVELEPESFDLAVAAVSIPANRTIHF